MRDSSCSTPKCSRSQWGSQGGTNAVMLPTFLLQPWWISTSFANPACSHSCEQPDRFARLSSRCRRSTRSFHGGAARRQDSASARLPSCVPVLLSRTDRGGMGDVVQSLAFIGIVGDVTRLKLNSSRDSLGCSAIPPKNLIHTRCPGLALEFCYLPPPLHIPGAVYLLRTPPPPFSCKPPIGVVAASSRQRQ